MLIALVATAPGTAAGQDALPDAGTRIEGVPFVVQEREQCGPAALWSVLSYYGSDVSPDSIADAVYNKTLKGSLVSDLENFARELDFQTELDRGSIPGIRDFLDMGRPVIALVDMGRWRLSKPHYLVLIGYSPEGIVAHDGETEARLFSYGHFERAWERAGRIYLVVYP